MGRVSRRRTAPERVRVPAKVCADLEPRLLAIANAAHYIRTRCRRSSIPHTPHWHARDRTRLPALGVLGPAPQHQPLRVRRVRWSSSRSAQWMHRGSSSSLLIYSVFRLSVIIPRNTLIVGGGHSLLTDQVMGTKLMQNDALRVSLRVLAAWNDAKNPDACDVETLRTISVNPSLPTDELACQIIQSILRSKSSVIGTFAESQPLNQTGDSRLT